MPSRLIFQRIASKHDIEKKLQPTLLQEVLEYLLYFIVVFFIVAIAFLMVKTYGFDSIQVSGDSMLPNYSNTNILYIDQLTPNFGDYRRGEVVVFLAPINHCNNERKLLIKRVIGLPNEKVVFEEGKVYIYNSDYPSGILLDEKSYLPGENVTYKRVKDGKERYEEAILKQNQYFVMGDNRLNSNDSRCLGPIQKTDVRGKEVYRLTPSEKAGLFRLPKYNISN
jgi:signal peptidase I